MSGAAPRLQKVTFDALDALDDDIRAEVIQGSLVEKAAPTMEHGRAQRSLGGMLGRRFDRDGGGRWPGGWWLATEVDVRYETHEIYRHDVVGWRRDRLPTCPGGRPIDERPDWVCEILSPSNYKRDMLDKMGILRASGVPHYWIVNVVEQLLIVHRLEPSGYLVALTASAGQTVQAEPFDSVDLPVAVLFGAADDE